MEKLLTIRLTRQKLKSWGEFFLAAFLLIGCGAKTPPQIIEEPQISVNTIYYQIHGETGDELRSQMDTLGVTGKEGNRYGAYTEWYVRWAYPYTAANGSCSTGRVEVSVEVTFTFPQWNNPANVPKSLIDNWNRYLEALQHHEEGHKQIAIRAGEEIFKALNELTTYPSCNELEQAADEIGESILEEYRLREEIYDEETGHGETQGVRFP